MQSEREILGTEDIPSESDILNKTLNSKLSQVLVLTTIKDKHGEFLNYRYFDADEFSKNINFFKSQRRIEDEYTEMIFNLFLELAELKNQKEQENNLLWINNKPNKVRPDIFNSSLSEATLTIINQKLNELRSEDSPLFNLQYVNYTQRLNQNIMCIERVEQARDRSIKSKIAKPLKIWQQAIKNNTSVSDIVNKSRSL